MVPILLARGNRDINDFIASICGNNRGKSNLVSLSLARAISDKLEVPREEVESLSIYFANTYKQDILKKLIQINESISIDKEKVMDYVVKLYRYRYNLVRTNNPVLCINKETAIEDFFGITRVFGVSAMMGDDIVSTIREHGNTIVKYVFKFNEILEKLD